MILSSWTSGLTGRTLLAWRLLKLGLKFAAVKLEVFFNLSYSAVIVENRELNLSSDDDGAGFSLPLNEIDSFEVIVSRVIFPNQIKLLSNVTEDLTNNWHGKSYKL